MADNDTQDAPKKRRGRPPGSTNRRKKTEPDTLDAALTFISQHIKSTEGYAGHLYIGGNWIVAFDGVLEIGFPVEIDLQACPQTGLFKEAMARRGKDLSITTLPSGALSIVSGKMRAVVPCMAPAEYPLLAPDPATVAVDDTLKTALAGVGSLVSDTAQFVVAASVMLKPGSVVATNRFVILEYWHGFQVPEAQLPKSAVNAVIKTPHKLTGFGASDNSATFWLDNGGFIRTQLYADEYPPTDRLFAKLSEGVDPWPAPKGMFEAVENVLPFTDENNVIYLLGDRVTTSLFDGVGAEYEVKGLPENWKFNGQYLMVIKDVAQNVAFIEDGLTLYFTGKNGDLMVRGAVSAMEYN